MQQRLTQNPLARFTAGTVVVLAIGLGLYVGIWHCLIGGVLNIIAALHPFDQSLLALGILKVFLTDVIGLGIFSLGSALADWVSIERKVVP